MFKQLQQVGKAFMLPIAILPAAGLFARDRWCAFQ